MQFTFVMSASINPNGMAGLSPEAVVNREDQYLSTLRFYAAQPGIEHILFVENSAWDLSRLRREVPSEKIQWVSLDENNFPREWGKGYGEFLLMDRAVDVLGSDCRGGG